MCQCLEKIDIFFSLSKCIVKFLLELGMDVSIDNYLAFKLIESVDILDLFLKYYPNIDINMYNDFAIRYAAKNTNTPYVYELIMIIIKA
ncbi:putative ankyrin repeat protein [Megavirus courdo11]|uniref:Putative ankyrin repeat protein n=1 Tax=Megavirus courdo11 TaxID=1128140 RepID=K7YFM2_9VIRU|nr:putative ankyrin repeat protein [Megavirus courdo11]